MGSWRQAGCKTANKGIWHTFRFHTIVRNNGFAFKSFPASVNERLFRNVVRRTFGARRKTLRNGLKMMGFSEDQLSSVAFDLARRPEQLSPGDFLELSELLNPHSTSLSLKY
jgi:hypothetical protein